MAFRIIKDIIKHLASYFKVINKQADTWNIYSQLRQGPQEHFRDFKIHFINMANRAQVSQDTQLNNIFQRLNPELQNCLLHARRTWNTLAKAITALDALDKELISYQQRLQKPPMRKLLYKLSLVPVQGAPPET